MSNYSDLDIFLTKNDLTSDINIKKGLQAVSQSIKNIALTRFGEKPFAPFFGSSLLESLSTSKNTIELMVISNQIKAEIENQEPRVIIDNVQIQKTIDGYDITINFTLKATNQQGSVPVTV